MNNFYIYLLVMAGITYLIRMVPFVLFKKKIKQRFVISFLYYVPYSVLSVMTVPAIFYSTKSLISAFVGFIVALLMSYFEKSLIKVAIFSFIAVFITEAIIRFIN